MSQAVPTQHPAVVLRSHYENVRALLAIAMLAVLALTATVVILATRDEAGPAGAVAPVSVSAPGSDGIRFDGGPEEGTGAIAVQPLSTGPATRYDGGPEEGASGTLSSGVPSPAAPGIRFDGGPEEGTAVAGR